MITAALSDDPRRRRGALASFQNSALCEALFAFAIILPLLFVAQLRSGAPALSFAATIAYGLVCGRAAGALRRCWPLLLVPGLAFLSTVWSAYHLVTLKHSLELLLTVAGGILLSASPRPAAMLTGVWAAFALFMMVSVALGHSIGVGSVTGDDQTAFAGLDGLKNFFGMIAALSVLTSVFVVARSIRTRSWLGVAAGMAILLVEVDLAIAARSAGAVIALILALAAFAVTASLGAVPARGRPIACGFLAVLLGAAGVLGYGFANSVTATTLALFHKDPTLTGRTYLWYRAGDFMRERPLFGHGFEAFWVPGNVDAEGLWTYGGITSQSGFNFHNTMIELVIDFGMIGAAFMLVLFLVLFIRLIWRTIREPSLTSAFYVGFVVFQLARTPFESIVPASVDFVTVLVFAGLGFGLRPLEHAAAAMVRSPRRMVVEPWRRRLQPRAPRPAWADRSPAPR